MRTPTDSGEPSNDEQVLVLHVDDEPEVAELAADYLERLNPVISVITETDAAAGLDRLDATPVDCVVSDYQMPGMDGIELLRAVRDEYPNLPFFLFTGKGSEDVASEAIDAGVTSYVQKGGTESYEQLANRIQNAAEQRRSERRARVARNRLLDLYEQTDGFYILDDEWTITYWNRRIADRTGLAGEEVLGRDFREVFPEARDTKVHDQFRTARETSEATDFEVHYESRGYWAEIRAYPVEDGLFVHSRDITDERTHKQELERRNMILQSFAHTVSHDLRNPLSIAEGNLELAQETGDFDHLEAVAQAHNRMRNLIDELLRLARGEQLQLSTVSLDAVTTEAWTTVSSETAELVVEEDVTFEAHESQLRRLFENLFWNAIEHGDATTIRVGRLDECGLFVADDGVGIPDADRERVFESGFSTVDGSPGYGLSIVDGIAETHGWEISLTEGQNGGARFEITGVAFDD